MNKANHAMAIMIVCCMQLHNEAHLAKGAVKPSSVARVAEMRCQRKHNSDLIDTLVSRIPIDLELLKCNSLKS